MLNVACSGCSKVYRVQEKFAGRKMRCRDCSQIIEIPVAGDDGKGIPAEATGRRSKELQETAVIEKRPQRSRGSRAGGKPRLERKTLPGGKVGRKIGGAPGKAGKAGKAPGSGRAIGRSRLASRSGRPADEGGEAAAAGKKRLVGVLAVVILGAGAVYLYDPFGWLAPLDGVVSDDAPVAEDFPAADDDDDPPEVAAGDEPADEVAIPTEPVDVIDVLPPDARFLVGVDVEQILSLVARIPMPGPPGPDPSAMVRQTLDEVGLEPGRITFASRLPPAELLTDSEKQAELQRELAESWSSPALSQQMADLACAVFEGTLDWEKLATAQEARVDQPRDIGRLEAYPTEYGSLTARLSETQVVFGGETSVEAVARRLAGEGASLRENEDLAALSDGFGGDRALWIALDLPDDWRKGIVEVMNGRPQVKRFLVMASIEEAPEIVGIFLGARIGLSDEEAVTFEARVRFANEQGAKDVMKVLAGFGAMSPEVRATLRSLKPRAEGQDLRLGRVVPLQEILALPTLLGLAGSEEFSASGEVGGGEDDDDGFGDDDDDEDGDDNDDDEDLDDLEDLDDDDDDDDDQETA